MNQTPLFDDLVIRPQTKEELINEVCALMELNKKTITYSDVIEDSIR